LSEKIPVSIVIPTYNRITKLFRLLKSLNHLNPMPDEVIIIDDHSNDQTPELLKRWKDIENRFSKKIVLKSENKGPADSRNIGIKNARNDLVAFADDDVIVAKDWIKYITHRLRNSESKLVGVGGIVKSVNNDIISQYFVENKTLEAPSHLYYIPTVNCCFKKKPLIDIGYFNTEFPFAGGEDTDLCLRLKRNGFYFVKDKKALVYHDFSNNFIDFCKNWLRYGKGSQIAIIRALKNKRKKKYDNSWEKYIISPKFNIQYLLSVLYYYVRIYVNSGIGFWKSMKFLFLKIIERLLYSYGTHVIELKNKNK
jgi:glycosyltransferase involved in cell wall biosynthesis